MEEKSKLNFNPEKVNLLVDLTNLKQKYLTKCQEMQIEAYPKISEKMGSMELEQNLHSKQLDFSYIQISDEKIKPMIEVLKVY